MCKNYSFKVNVQAKKSSFSFPSPPPRPPPTEGREKGKEKLDFAARTLSLNKQYSHSSHQIYVKKYYFYLMFYPLYYLDVFTENLIKYFHHKSCFIRSHHDGNSCKSNWKKTTIYKLFFSVFFIAIHLSIYISIYFLSR